ncbi:hypothetical protein JDW21_18660 [Bacillus subtilis]|uniref:hypothetical protein n=1 Tax=Bacillus subtilis TaxID=1423 RepID=UPI0021504CE8|nr:hypothetical protein [Bacillus subtilis]MCR4362171.1 hypothetical protein [Bacillus subtilis]WOF32852.1 hypothetical protein OEJ84_23415 [Bacillus subtilis]
MKGLLSVKIRLPNGQNHILDDNLTLEEKISVCKNLTERFKDSIEENWLSDPIKFFLDSLSNYINWHKEPEDNTHDKEVMSRNKTNRMLRGRKDILFSDLSSQDKEQLFGENRGVE